MAAHSVITAPNIINHVAGTVKAEVADLYLLRDLLAALKVAAQAQDRSDGAFAHLYWPSLFEVAERLLPDSDTMSDMQRAAMTFSYLRDDKAGFEKALWNCSEYKRDDTRQCMKR